MMPSRNRNCPKVEPRFGQNMHPCFGPKMQPVFDQKVHAVSDKKVHPFFCQKVTPVLLKKCTPVFDRICKTQVCSGNRIRKTQNWEKSDTRQFIIVINPAGVLRQIFPWSVCSSFACCVLSFPWSVCSSFACCSVLNFPWSVCSSFALFRAEWSSI